MADSVIYPCGTFAPGFVHDPCQHSTIVVLCCWCAGCMNDVWFCHRAHRTHRVSERPKDPSEPTFWYDGEVLAGHFGQTSGLIVCALLILVLLTCGVIPFTVRLCWWIIQVWFVLAT